MSNPSKVKGDKFEIAIREHCRAAGFDADRTRAGYARDHGDIHLGATVAGPRVIVQAKNEREIRLAAYVRGTAEQRDAAGAEVGFTVIKQRGTSDPGQSFALMSLDDLLALLRRAGYGVDDPFGTTCIDCSEAINDARPYGATTSGDLIHTDCGDPLADDDEEAVS